MNFLDFLAFCKKTRTSSVLSVLVLLLTHSAAFAEDRADRNFALSITHRDFRLASGLDRIEGWYVDVLTFDLDGDGDLDAIATDTNCDGSWELHRFDSQEWSHFIPSRAHKDDPSQYLTSRLFQWSCSFFVVSNRDESASLLSIELPHYGDNETPQAPDNGIGRTVTISLTNDGCAAFDPVPGGREAILSDAAFSSIQRILPVKFRGTNVVEAQTDWYGYTNIPPAWLRSGLAFSRTERIALRIALNDAGKTNAASCIVCDADGDGRSDAYVSFHVNQSSSDESDWFLWVQTTNGWRLAESATKNSGLGEPSPFGPNWPKSPGRWDDPRDIAPSVHASASDFYRVYRPDGTTWPAVFPRAPDGTFPEEFHRLFEVGAAFMRLERILPEALAFPSP